MRRSVAATLVLGVLAGTSSVACENTAEDCAKLGTCTGGGGTGATGGTGGTGATGGTGGTGATGGGGTGGVGGATDTGSTGSTASCTGEKVSSYGAAGDQSARSVLAASANDIVLAGSFDGTFKFGMKQLVPESPGPTSFVARADGNFVSNKAWAYGVEYLAGALTGSGALVFVGVQTTMVDLGCGAIDLDPAFPEALFVARIDQDGACDLHKVFGADGVSAASVAVGADGEIALAGTFSGSIDLDGSPVTPLDTSAGALDVFVLKLTADGAPAWFGSYGDAGDDVAGAVAFGASGTVVVAGDHTGSLNLNNGGTALESGTGAAAFVLSFDAQGSVLWARSFQVAGGVQRPSALAIDTSDAAGARVVLAGDIEGVGGVALQPAVGGDVMIAPRAIDRALFVSRFSLAAGVHLGTASFPGSGGMKIGGAAVDAAGRVVLAGWLDTSIDFEPAGAGELTSAGGTRGFMAVLDAALAHRKSLAFEVEGGQSRALGLALEDDFVLVAGDYSGKLTVAGQSHTSSGADDLFVARICKE